MNSSSVFHFDTNSMFGTLGTIRLFCHLCAEVTARFVNNRSEFFEELIHVCFYLENAHGFPYLVLFASHHRILWWWNSGSSLFFPKELPFAPVGIFTTSKHLSPGHRFCKMKSIGEVLYSFIETVEFCTLSNGPATCIVDLAEAHAFGYGDGLH